MSTVMEPAVAKKQAGKPAPKSPKEEEKGSEREPLILQVRGSLKFKEWYKKLARHDGRTLAAVFERSAALYAKEVGFEEPPPSRRDE